MATQKTSAGSHKYCPLEKDYVLSVFARRAEEHYVAIIYAAPSAGGAFGSLGTFFELDPLGNASLFRGAANVLAAWIQAWHDLDSTDIGDAHDIRKAPLLRLPGISGSHACPSRA